MPGPGARAPREYDALGLKFALDVESDEPEPGIAVTELLRVFETDRSSGLDRRYRIDVGEDGAHRLARDSMVLDEDRSWQRIATALMVDLNRGVLDAFQGFAVHAGVVAAGNDVVAFPGESGIGKSTLTVACLDAGFSYVSDEALCIDHDDGHVVPYPRPIGLSHEGWHLARSGPLGPVGVDDGTEVLFTPAQLEAHVAGGELRVAHVVDLVRSDGPARLVALSRSTTLSSLLEMSFNHYKAPDAAFRIASELATRAHAWRLEYSDPKTAATLLLSALT